MKSKIKVPFELHDSVRAISQIALPRMTDCDLSPDAETIAAAANRVVAFANAKGEIVAASGDLAGTAAEHVLWSNDGKRVATMEKEWKGNDITAHISVWSWPEGKRIAKAKMEWGSVSHAMPGVSAPTMSFSPDDTRLFIRSAKMGFGGTDQKNVIASLDVASGKLLEAEIEGDGYLFSVAAIGDRVFGLFDRNTGLVWLDAKTLKKKGVVEDVSGEQVLPGASSLWVVGDSQFAWRVDVDAIEKKAAKPSKTYDAKTERWERNRALASRAKAKWDVDHLSRAEEDEVRVPKTPPGVHAFMHHEPWGMPQAARIGDDDLLVRDGVRLARWRTRDGKLEVTTLIEDKQRATTQQARHMVLSARKNRFVLGWRKSLNAGEWTCTFFEVVQT